MEVKLELWGKNIKSTSHYLDTQFTVVQLILTKSNPHLFSFILVKKLRCRLHNQSHYDIRSYDKAKENFLPKCPAFH